MADAYHRRPIIAPDDIAALTLTGIGSGINLYGDYMFHGGANPKGRLTTLQESTATGYPNDLPEISYDFQAPLGEFGQVRESYRKIRVLHLINVTLAVHPGTGSGVPTGDVALVPGSNGSAGFVFVNNYVRQLSMPPHPNFQAHIKLIHGDLTLPAKPFTIPANAYFAFPFNLTFGKLKLNYATAQLLAQLDNPTGKLIIFFAIPGIAPEFSFDPATSSKSILHPHAGRNATFEVIDRSGTKTTFLVLTEYEAERAAILKVANADHLVLSASDVFSDGNAIHLRSTISPTQTLSIYPDAKLCTTGKRNGLFTDYTLSQPQKLPILTIKQTQLGAPRPRMDPGPFFDWRKRAVPAVPPLAAFEQAASWRLQWQNPDLHGLSNILLQIDYTGDIARISSNTTPLDDNFYNGLPWQIGLAQFESKTVASKLTLRILPMPRVAPIYLDSKARASLDRSRENPQVAQARLIPEYESIFTVVP